MTYPGQGPKVNRDSTSKTAKMIPHRKAGTFKPIIRVVTRRGKK